MNMIFNRFSILLVSISWIKVLSSAAGTEDIRIAQKADKKFEATLKKVFTDYNPGTRPNVTGAPVVATINLYVIKVEEIEEVQETFSLDLYLRVTWNDYRLRHNQSKIVLQAENANKIWSPDVFFPNALKSDSPKITKDNQHAHVSSNGEVLWVKRVSVTANCNLDLKSFPLDKQKCSLHVESYSYSADDLVLRWNYSSPVSIEDKRMPGYEITGIDVSFENASYIEGNFSRLSVITTYSRLLGFYMFQIYIPCTLIVVTSWLTFWLKADEPGDRVALAITTILAIVFLLQFTSSSLPRVNYAKGIDYYLISCFVQIFFGLLETVIATNYVKKQQKSSDGLKTKVNAAEISGCSELNMNSQQQDRNVIDDGVSSDGFSGDMATKDKAAFNFPATTTTTTTTTQDKDWSDVNIIDRVSRVAFPLVFALFNLMYWVIFIYKA